METEIIATYRRLLFLPSLQTHQKTQENSAEYDARLPETEDGLEDAARAYYGARQLLPVAGSQAAIQALPLLRTTARVGVLTPCYAEHPYAWQRAGHQLLALDEAHVEAALDGLDVLVLVNPNNPTGQRVSRERLLAWHARLAARGGDVGGV